MKRLQLVYNFWVLDLSTISRRACHALFTFIGFAFAFSSWPLSGQTLSSEPVGFRRFEDRNFFAALQQITKPPRPNAPAEDEIRVQGVHQEEDGPVVHLRVGAEVETTDMLLKAEEIDYNTETGYAEARGNVRFKNYDRGETLECDRLEYDITAKQGKFYNVRGTSQTKILAKPGLLSTNNPFYFEGKWAERLEDHYILHDGFITNCKIPKPWWTFRAPTFDIVPDERAIAHKAMFRLRRIPIFYTPFFYKSLEKFPRRSGFLQPNIGNSSRRGKMVGFGYYWAINRSYDAMYRGQLFTERGFAHTFDIRGKPNERSDFNFYLYGVQDRGLQQADGSRVKQGGYLFTFTGRTELGHGWSGRALVNYLSSFTFRQQFTESFNEAIYSEVHSIGSLSKHWNTYGINIAVQRDENIQNILYSFNERGQLTGQRDEKVIIQKLPQVQFLSREHLISRKGLPIWVSLDSRVGALQREDPQFANHPLVERADFQPRVTTAFNWLGISLVPSFTLHETHYSSRLQNDAVKADSLLRQAREANVELVLPSLSRTFKIHNFLGEQLKHVIEPRANFRYIGGVSEFQDIVRFDELDILNNTKEVEISLTNRLFAKQKNGQVTEVASWQLWQRRYFEPDFGGVLVPERRNVLLSSIDLTAQAFLDQPRNYSPIVSVLRFNPNWRTGIEWRADYDPLKGQISSSLFTADTRIKRYSLSVGHNQVRGVPSLTPDANQIRGQVGYGQENQHGWNAAFLAFYDYRQGVLQYANTQISYNTDCCGFSVQFRRFSFGTRNENQFRLAFVIANIGSFGTLKRQERIF